MTPPAEGPGAGPPRAVALALAFLFAALIGYAFLWPRAAWLFVPARDRPAVEHALAAAAASFSATKAEDYRWIARPVVTRSGGRVCVTLASARDPFGQGYRACHDESTGALVEERAWVS